MALNQEYIRKTEYYIKNITKRMYKPMGELTFDGFFTYDRLTLNQAENHSKEKISKGQEWGRRWEYGWFFSKITIPEECAGKKVIFTGKQGESTVFVNGENVGALDREHTHIILTESAEEGEIFEIAMEAYAGHMKDDFYMDEDKVTLVLPDTGIKPIPEDEYRKRAVNGSYGIFYEEVFSLWMDIKTLYDLYEIQPENSLRKAKIGKAISKVCDILDIEEETEDFLLSVKAAAEILKPVLEAKNGTSAPTVYATGHSHLDLEWLWTREETRRKAARTLGNQIKLMEEYPDYKYIQSQLWILEQLKNDYPKLYEKVKEKVKSGNITVEGGSWVEPDVNIPCGESLIRQFMTGKKFIKDEFGYESEMFWLPDSFGMTAALPQILKGCGIKYFMNAKIMWQYNGGEEIPRSNFIWQGIDGSEILTHLTQGYAEMPKPSVVAEKWNLNREKADVPIGMISYGYGDGGGGATKEHLEYVKREKDLEGMPKVVLENPMEFFKVLESECEVSGRYVGELYYAAHRGTYTTQAKTKFLNRRSEEALRTAEMWSAFFDNDTKADTDVLWKTVLFNQFHDIIPGTSIEAVYEKTEEELTDVVNKAEEISDSVICEGLNIKKSDVNEPNINEDKYITVFNSLSWGAEKNVELPKGYTLAENCEVQKIGDKVIAKLYAPPCGYKTYKLLKTGDLIDTLQAQEVNTDTADNVILENNLIKAEFNKNGYLVSVYDKENSCEMLKKPSNVFRLYRDMATFFDAWDIDSFYENTEVKLDDTAKITVMYTGELQSCIKIEKKLNKSYLIQKVVLNDNSKEIVFETEVDWQETHKLLKVDFDTNIHTEELLSDIQFGYIKRPNHKSRHYDGDRFEVCQHKWSALCEANRGAAILNDGKYGISAEGGKMSLTLLRSTVNPAPYADKGIQKFVYSFMPFSGSVSEEVYPAAYKLNVPLSIKSGCVGNEFEPEKSFISLSENNIVLETVKFAEENNSKDIIIRLYENSNAMTNCEIKFDLGFEVKEVYYTDMLENEIEKITVADNEAEIKFSGFEVVTIKVKR